MKFGALRFEHANIKFEAVGSKYGLLRFGGVCQRK